MGLAIVIVGAGIGGLTAALALSDRGHDVTLVERRTGFTELGAGIQLSPNASRILADLGLGPALRRLATEPDGVTIRAVASGRRLGDVALGPAMRERFDAPYLLIHRADLQTILLDAVRGRSTIRLLLGREAVMAETVGNRAAVTVEKSGGARETLEAAVAIGADGVWSKLRRAIGDDRAPIYRGHVAWRATAPREAVPATLAGNRTGLWLGPGAHVVHYPIAGGKLVNIVAVRERRQPVEGWSAAGDPNELSAAFAEAAPDLRALLAAAGDWRLWSLYDLPATSMARGRIALLGDAAHPVLPYLAQGGALAVEDAAALAGALDAVPDEPERALAAYAAARLKRVRRVQDAARRNGTVYHAGALVAFGRDLVMRRLGPAGMTERYAWLYGWRPGKAA